MSVEFAVYSYLELATGSRYTVRYILTEDRDFNRAIVILDADLIDS